MEALMDKPTQIATDDSIPQLLNRCQTAKLLNISIELLDLKIKAQEIPVVRIGRSVRLKPSDITAFIDRHLIGGK
jgi:excisionase family DNA binding protein